MANYKKIGIMGGTFDPVHYGHLVLAEQVRSNLRLDCIYFVPSGDPPHKTDKVITDKYLRYEMVLLATVDNPRFDILDTELKSDKMNYTIDSIREIKKDLGINDEVYFITGADQILNIESWKDYKTLLRENVFIGASRPGYAEDELYKKISMLKEELHANIIHIEVPALAISSTDIRNRIREGNTIRYLLPESVEQYIYKHKLYKSTANYP